MRTLEIEMYVEGSWQTTAQVEFGDGSIINTTNKLNYEMFHQVNFLNDCAQKACSVNYPVSFDIYRENKVLGFIEDIIPAGAAKQKWLEREDIKQAADVDFALLSQGAISPVGNIRIKTAVETLDPSVPILYFDIKDVCNRDTDFLSYAHEKGALTGGASGAGGEAPKLLLRKNHNNQVWIDCFQDTQSPDLAYLVKFPRGKRTEIDQDILRAEYAYYEVIHKAGFDTIDPADMELEKGVNIPSLWLPRFDLIYENGQEVRHGLESILSVIKGTSGQNLNHFDVIAKVISNMRQATAENDIQFDQALFVRQWFERDLLNVMFGNSDNHARNSSLIKKQNEVKLSPIYDFAPMRVDPEDIRRTITWGTQYELGGEYKWDQIIKRLAQYCAEQQIDHDLSSLQTIYLNTLNKFENLPELLAENNCPQSILTHPKNHFNYWQTKFEKWINCV